MVLDASAVVTLLLGGSAGAAVAARLQWAPGPRRAPHVLDLEVAQTFRRLTRAGRVDDPTAAACLRDFRDLGLEYHPHGPLLPRIWELRDNLTAYDAAYVALAEALDAPLLTADARLAAAPGHRARIEVLGTPGVREPRPRVRRRLAIR